MNLTLNNNVNFNGYIKGPNNSRFEKQNCLFADRMCYGQPGGYIHHQVLEADTMIKRYEADGVDPEDCVYKMYKANKDNCISATLDKEKSSVIFKIPKDKFNTMFGAMHYGAFKDNDKSENPRIAELRQDREEVHFTYNYPDGKTFEWKFEKAEAQEEFEALLSPYKSYENKSDWQQNVFKSHLKEATSRKDEYLKAFYNFLDGVRVSAKLFLDKQK